MAENSIYVLKVFSYWLIEMKYGPFESKLLGTIKVLLHFQEKYSWCVFGENL